MSEQKPVAWRKQHVVDSTIVFTYTDKPESVAAWAERGVTLEPLFLAAPPEQPALTLDAIYAAWHGAGVDIAGGDWNRFVGMLPHCMTAQPAPAQQWLPIETAPSDVVVLLYTPHIHESNQERVEARVYHDSRAGSWHGWATHWMPLPSAPKATK